MNNRRPSFFLLPPFFLFRFSFFLSLPLLAGCTALGVAAYKLSPPPTIQAQYTNLKNESVGVMVWADRGLRIDWPSLQLDLANEVQKKLSESKKKEVSGATFPVQPASIVRYQRDNPQIEALQVTEVAPKLGVSRLIYIELEDFATRSDMSVDLFRGQARAAVRVVEVDAAGNAKIAFENSKVAAQFPAKTPREGLPTIGDARIYAGLVDALATEVAHLFIPYQVEE
jgi:hypothetical protein